MMTSETVWQHNARTFATTDAEHNAALTVAVARQQALALIVDGKPGRARYTLARAIASAARQLGVREAS